MTPRTGRLAMVAVLGAAVWLGPLLLLAAVFGPRSALAQVGFFNAKMAVYQGACPVGPNTAIACNDNFCGSSPQVTAK